MTRRTDPRSSTMTPRSPVRRRLLALPTLAGVGAAGLVVLAALLVFARGMPVRSEITVFRRPGCVCCLAWVARLREAGFDVAVQDEPHRGAVRLRLGVPNDKASCHTALTREGYVIEGHVPPKDLRRWLQERPPLRGLAVAGMPAGSPGMESPRPEAYDVWALPRDGDATVYAHHPATGSVR